MSAVETRSMAQGVEIRGAWGLRYEEALNDRTLDFLAALHRKFNPSRLRLLKLREERQARLDAGALPDFLPETKHVRDGNWKVAPIPADLLDRRVEITGPVDRKMIVNALNSGAKVFMADFEDANAPTWSNQIEGQINLKDRWDDKIDFTDPTTGKDYKLAAKPAVLLVPPTGLTPAILEAIKPMLQLMPIAYTIRVRTASNRVFQHTRTELAEPEPAIATDLDLPLSS